MSDHHHAHSGAHGALRVGGVKDPVCGMRVDPHTAKHRHVHNGLPYYFCSGRCREKFAADPAKYLDPAARAAEPVPAGTIYTCPMHPEIRQVGPGACPICGMALEPEFVTADVGPNPEFADMSRRLWIALALTVPVFALEMGGHLIDLHRWIGQQLGADGVRHARGAVGRLAVLRARLGIAQDAQPQHVHADRHGYRRGLGLQRGGHAGARAVPGGDAGPRRLGSRLLRGGGGHHGAGAGRPGSRIAGARADRRRHPSVARPVPEDGA